MFFIILFSTLTVLFCYYHTYRQIAEDDTRPFLKFLQFIEEMVIHRIRYAGRCKVVIFMPVAVQLCNECRDLCGIFCLCFCLDLFHKLTLLFFSGLNRILKARTPCHDRHGVLCSVMNIIYSCGSILYALRLTVYSCYLLNTNFSPS